MYNKLRTKFVFLSLSIITAILVLLLGGINIATFVTNRKQADQTISSYVVVMEKFQSGNLSFEEYQAFETLNANRYRDENYFVVSVGENGKYIITNKMFADTIAPESAVSFYELALSRNKEKGYIDGYRYLNENGKIYFLDCRHYFDSQLDFFNMSCLFSIGGIAIFAVCLFFGSALIFKNVKANDSKQKEFITDASHQLKTPLMVISANNDLISIKNGDSEETKVISEQIEQMTSMINTLLTISKSQEAINNSLTVVSVSSIVNETIELFKPLYNAKKLTLDCKIDDDINILSDGQSISEIAKIILENASKYAKTSVSITLKKENRYAELIEINDSDFTDTKNLNYLTERFVRDEINSNLVSGSGIGLALLKSLLDNHKATLDLNTKEGKFILKIRFRCK